MRKTKAADDDKPAAIAPASGRTSLEITEPECPAIPSGPRFFERKLSAVQLADGIDSYLNQCEEAKRKPTKPGLCNYLGISTKTLDNWAKQAEEAENGTAKDVVGNKYRAYAFPIKRAQQAMADELEQRTDTMALFLLKQSWYGGYTDKGDNVPGGGNLAINITFGETHKNTARNYGK